MGWGGNPPADPGTPHPCPCSIEGGELFERIVDDDYHLTEVDCMVFVRQICEGIRFMHHMRVLHLDLKVRGWGAGGSRCSWWGGTRPRSWALTGGSLSPQPENILCVAATGHMVKIIDFGLARRCRAPPLPVVWLPVVAASPSPCL